MRKSKCYLELCSGLEYDGKIKRWSKFIDKWLDLKLAAWGSVYETFLYN